MFKTLKPIVCLNRMYIPALIAAPSCLFHICPLKRQYQNVRNVINISLLTILAKIQERQMFILVRNAVKNKFTMVVRPS